MPSRWSALAAFDSTAIAIERTPERAATYDSLYAAYRAGARRPDPRD